MALKTDMSAGTWSAIRHALAIALARGEVTQREYNEAMFEISGTADRNYW